MINSLNNSRNNNINTFKSQNSKIVTIEEPKTKILKDVAFFAAEFATIKVANSGFKSLKKLTPFEAIGGSLLAMTLAFMKSGSKKTKKEIKINNNNNNEKETVKKALIKNTFFETILVPTLVFLGCMVTGKKENIKNNVKETLACVGIISGLNCLLSGLINKSIYDKYNKSMQKSKTTPLIIGRI